MPLTGDARTSVLPGQECLWVAVAFAEPTGTFPRTQALSAHEGYSRTIRILRHPRVSPAAAHERCVLVNVQGFTSLAAVSLQDALAVMPSAKMTDRNPL